MTKHSVSTNPSSAEDAADPEANLLAGEILVQRNQFPEAEPYLLKCANLKPELVPRCSRSPGEGVCGNRSSTGGNSGIQAGPLD